MQCWVAQMKMILKGLIHEEDLISRVCPGKDHTLEKV